MKSIDLKKLIEDHNLDIVEVSMHLFPDRKFPRLALNRVISGESTLNADQISKLASMAGIEIEKMFTPSGWITTPVDERNKMVFENGEYKAVLDTDKWTTTLLHKGSLFHEEVLHPSTISLNDYLTRLNNLILKSQKNDKFHNRNKLGFDR